VQKVFGQGQLQSWMWSLAMSPVAPTLYKPDAHRAVPASSITRHKSIHVSTAFCCIVSAVCVSCFPFHTTYRCTRNRQRTKRQ
jgi:hypothetical protein